MNKVHLIKAALLGLVITSSAVVQARDYANKGAYLDASQNLYTASYYPASANMRVSKRNSSNSTFWVKDFAAASGWKFNSQMIVRPDASGNVWVACQQYQPSGTSSRFALYKLTSAGANTSGSPTYYQPVTGQSVFLGGFALDSTGRPYLVGSYNDASLGTLGFALRYTSYPTGGATQGVNISGYMTYVDDIAIDSSDNVFVGSHSWPSAGSTEYATITKFTSSFGAGTNYSDTLPSGWFSINSGCLTLDSSSRLTYLLGVNGSLGRDVFGTQRNTSGTLTWTPGLLGLTSMDTSWSSVDSSGNIYVAGAATASVYEVAKISSSKTVLWSNTVSTSNIYPQGLSIDSGGDAMVVTAAPSGGNTVSRVMRFNGTTGANSANYDFSGAALSDYGYSVFSAPSTSGTFYVQGVGKSGSVYYPLVYKYAVSGGSPVLSWSAYQTATTP